MKRPWRTFFFDQDLRDAFRTGRLRQQWATRYPDLFDERDARLAKNQPHYHFCEWLAAVRILEGTGFQSLLCKYHLPGHKRKFAEFKRRVSDTPAVFDLLTSRREFGSQGGPDLFCYCADGSEWFFCEVKGPRDRLQPKPAALFKRLEEVSSRPVRLAHVRVTPQRRGALVREGA